MDRAEGSFRPFNVRYLPLFAAFFILGIFCVKTAIYVAAILWTVATFCALALLFTKQIKWGVALALMVVLFLGYGGASLELYLRNDVGLSGRVQMTCRVTEVSLEDGVYTVTADNLRAGKSYGGGVTFQTEEALEAGDRVTLYGEVFIKKLSLDNFSQALLYRKGCKYAALDVTILEVKDGAEPLAGAIRKGARDILIKNQGSRAGAFSYATLFGDTEYMQSEDKTAMREVGVAHVFAVSGLHIGVLAAALLLLLRKLKVKDGISLLILLPIFGFYAYLSGFTPSVLRASIMVSVGLAASHFGGRYDDISSMSLAAILILLARPLLLFDISFAMSFLAIFGVQCLGAPLKGALVRRRVKRALAEAIAISLSTTVAILPVSAVVFGRISLVGFLLNIVVVPMASVSFILTLIGLILTAALPAFGAVLEAVSVLPKAITEVSSAVSSLNLTASYNFSAAEILVYYAILFFVGKYCLVPKKVKLVTGGMGLGVLAILILAV